MLYGKEGTLFLDLEAKKLFLTRKGAEGKREEVAISEDKKESWKVWALAPKVGSQSCICHGGGHLNLKADEVIGRIRTCKESLRKEQDKLQAASRSQSRPADKEMA